MSAEEILANPRNRRNLEGAYLARAYLAGARLDEANLREAILEEADLEGANLDQADLRGANLYGANLVDANLTGALLVEADLVEADLERADLRWADLIGADLTDADLTGANLTGARVERASLALAIGVNQTGVVYIGEEVALRDDLLVIDEIGVCPICHEEGGPGVLTTCEHEFHASCLLEWKRTGHGGCPMCRGEGTFFGTVRIGSK